MRTNPEHQKLAYCWISMKRAGELLGVNAGHVLALGRSGQLEIADMRLPGAARGVYRVNPDTVEVFLTNRRVGAA